jgi:hypothetical protein
VNVLLWRYRNVWRSHCIATAIVALLLRISSRHVVIIVKPLRGLPLSETLPWICIPEISWSNLLEIIDHPDWGVCHFILSKPVLQQYGRFLPDLYVFTSYNHHGSCQAARHSSPPPRCCENSLKSKEYNTKLRGFSPQANYTDRATAACRRSQCQL